MLRKVTAIEELSEKEINVLFSGFGDGCRMEVLKDEDLLKSLQEKGYFGNGENADITIEGKQNVDRYWYERSEIILEELSKSNDMESIYINVFNRINITKPLFFTFIDNLVSIGKITEVSRYIHRDI